MDHFSSRSGNAASGFDTDALSSKQYHRMGIRMEMEMEMEMEMGMEMGMGMGRAMVPDLDNENRLLQLPVAEESLANAEGFEGTEADLSGRSTTTKLFSESALKASDFSSFSSSSSSSSSSLSAGAPKPKWSCSCLEECQTSMMVLVMSDGGGDDDGDGDGDGNAVMFTIAMTIVMVMVIMTVAIVNTNRESWMQHVSVCHHHQHSLIERACV